MSLISSITIPLPCLSVLYIYSERERERSIHKHTLYTTSRSSASNSTLNLILACSQVSWELNWFHLWFFIIYHEKKWCFCLFSFTITSNNLFYLQLKVILFFHLQLQVIIFLSLSFKITIKHFWFKITSINIFFIYY